VAALRRIAILAALALSAALPAGAAAAPGQVDPSYGYYGTVDVTDALPGSEFQRGALAAAVGPQDESVVLSYALKPCVPGGCADLYVTRVSADGVLDTAFAGRAGRVATVNWGSVGAETGPNGAIGVQPDGKVVVAAGDGTAAQVVRLNPDGSRDLSFRNPAEPIRPTGESVVLLGGPTTVTDLGFRPTGQVVVAGGSGGSFFVSQLSADGQADSGFGVRGTRFDSVQPGGLPGGLLLRGATTVVGGNACCASPTFSMALAGFDAVGNLADVVRVKLPRRLGAGKPKGIADVIGGPKGSTFVVGSATKGTFVAKYLGSGRPDRSFRDGGFALVRGLRSEPGSALLDSHGRVVVLGTRLDVPDTMGFRERYVATVRLLPSGRVDPSYGGVRPLLVVEERGQKVGLDFGRSLGLSRRSDGRLIMLGEATPDRYAKTPSGPRFGLVRYLAGGRLKR
jgi:uncharacterized delta-60 repeat protein